jgi:POT family proton-dependent oligopeptide transporter
MVGNQEFFVAYVLWAKGNLQLTFGAFEMPATWLFAIAAVLSSGSILLSMAFWRWWGKRWKEPDELMKMGCGALVAACGPLVLAAASAVVASTGHKVGIVWSLAYEIIADLGFANLFPIGIALYSRVAPKALTGVMVGVYFLHLAAANLFVGRLGGMLEHMSGAQFWEMHSGIVAIAGVLLIVVRQAFGRELAREDEFVPAAPALSQAT